MLSFAAICPHPPLIIPEVGGSQTILAKKTIDALEKLAKELQKAAPDTIIIISPHGPMRYDKFTINFEDDFKGSFSDFGAIRSEYSFSNNQPLAKLIFSELRKKHFPLEVVRESIVDHGVLVPLHHLLKDFDWKPKIIPLTYTALDWETHFNFGRFIDEVIDNIEGNVAIIASGDMSHRLTDDAPAGFSPYGVKFDQTLTELLKKDDVSKIMNLNPDFCEEAGECALRSIIIALGALDAHKYTFKQLSYEGPIGVGYLVGHWKIS